MAQNKLVNRTKPGDAIDNVLLGKLTFIAKKTGIPRSRLTDRAIELLCEQYSDILKEYEDEK